jgi:hypothetical protein
MKPPHFFLTDEHLRFKVWFHTQASTFVRIVNCDSSDGATLVAEKCDHIGDCSNELFYCERSQLEEPTKELWEKFYPNNGANLLFEEVAA